ncbi:MAG TPA: glycosyltransferase [Flavitalea sp.]|nr:glycosyltransferase [Flavitalea sp.]
MQGRVINIVDNVKATNAGVWNAAISTAQELSDRSWFSELWFPDSKAPTVDLPVKLYPLRSRRLSEVDRIIQERDLNRNRDLIVTHGCWSYCTRWGWAFQRLGFKWLYTPHGMLEPWALTQKFLKKKLYLKLFEMPMARHSSAIRAVSTSESHNLGRIFKNTKLQVIPNGVLIKPLPFEKVSNITQYLFLGRLHRKKGILELVLGWKKSILNNNPKYRLVVAGPDDGELKKLSNYISSSSNIVYVGPVFGEEKDKLFSESTFFVLPSHSEGLPTSILEAMSNGLYLLISSGCNLPEVFSLNLRMRVKPVADLIAEKLTESSLLPIDMRNEKILLAREFVLENFSIRSVALQQLEFYQTLFPAPLVNE